MHNYLQNIIFNIIILKRSSAVFILQLISQTVYMRYLFYLANILMPASVIGGVIGFILMNIPAFVTATGVDAGMCNTIVGFFFTLSFISIGLTATPKEEGRSSGETGKQMLKGSLGMGLLWGALYCFTPIVGFLCIALLGAPFGMDAGYGALIQFAFCQGPVQEYSSE